MVVGFVVELVLRSRVLTLAPIIVLVGASIVRHEVLQGNVLFWS